MALPDVTFVVSSSGLGRPLPGTDYVSAILMYSDATLPTGFNSSNRIKIVYSVSDAEALGITDTSLGETKSTATYLFTTKYTAGATHVFTVATIASTSPITADAIAGTRTLASFTAVTADAVSITTSGDRLAAEINLGTATHGFTAVNVAGTVTLTAEAGQGIFLNSGTPYVSTIVGGGAGTLTQNVVPGVASDIDILHYHASEFFRLQPKGKLYVGIYATADVATFASVTLMQNFAVGDIKQMFIYEKSTAFSTAHCNTLQGIVTTLRGLHKPLAIIYGAEISASVDLSLVTTNLRALSDPDIAVTIGQDGAADGFKLWKATGKSITNGGEMLGVVALSKVNESIAWLGKFQVASSELDVVAFANGQLFTALSDGTVVALDTQGFCFLRKVIDLSGTYHNRPNTCVAITNDFAFMNLDRVMNKVVKSLRALLLPQTSSPVLVNSDGTLTEDVIGFFESLCDQAMAEMISNTEISNNNTIINPAQNVLSTGILYITEEIQPTGSADFITVNVGFVLAVTTK